jgi:catechol 2,3-dioxygenase-like lactoylglutathione lyase family enzyme
MKRVTGIGGVFFKCKDPERTRAWYKKHLDLPADEYGAIFRWRDEKDPEKAGYTVWSPFPQDTNYFSPSEKNFMFNYRVDDLELLLSVLKEEGVEVVGEVEKHEYGKFGWIMDPDGNKIELWEPADSNS